MTTKVKEQGSFGEASLSQSGVGDGGGDGGGGDGGGGGIRGNNGKSKVQLLRGLF